MASAAEQLAANIKLSSFTRSPELMQRIWFTLGALIVYRLGTYIRSPALIRRLLKPRSPGRSRASSTSSICSPAAPCSAWRCSR